MGALSPLLATLLGSRVPSRRPLQPLCVWLKHGLIQPEIYPAKPMGVDHRRRPEYVCSNRLPGKHVSDLPLHQLSVNSSLVCMCMLDMQGIFLDVPQNALS
ncbi:hypothetical protein BO78DRAFT_112152 [Aspergillus sclerotiicarbonarius CBS 121057]|uniref:Uncharacterized protein n=1 Tax=Aspergillus sclerotiicarbonarius (strain CBS 121057 / IBT 28362) TaxID=1448318 RepID=A0A319EWX0_ASPSB|nr:hypothetical protein BO78DRAFT_112152 [Aspergillus sclerotiicarbonarius CBS 121057]